MFLTGSLTFTFIQMPAIILAIFTILGALAKGCREGFGSDQAKKFLSVVLLLLVPFPVLIFVQQVASIFIRTDQMEYWSILFLFGEGSLEAPPQLLLMMYIIFSDSEREVAWVTWVCTPCAEIDKKKCAGHRSTPIYEQSSAPPLKAPRGLQGGPLQSESIHSSLDIFKGSGHQKSESVFREFILRLELLSANYITTHLKLLSYSFECL